MSARVRIPQYLPEIVRIAKDGRLDALAASAQLDQAVAQGTYDFISPLDVSYIAFRPVRRHSRLTDVVSANSSWCGACCTGGTAGEAGGWADGPAGLCELGAATEKGKAYLRPCCRVAGRAGVRWPWCVWTVRWGGRYGHVRGLCAPAKTSGSWPVGEVIVGELSKVEVVHFSGHRYLPVLQLVLSIINRVKG